MSKITFTKGDEVKKVRATSEGQIAVLVKAGWVQESTPAAKPLKQKNAESDKA